LVVPGLRPGNPSSVVRHEWQTTGHSGVDEFEIGEFLEQESAARDALIDNLFQVHADA
jgi:hypothetical protein